jgi:hypothetical protein
MEIHGVGSQPNPDEDVYQGWAPCGAGAWGDLVYGAKAMSTTPVVAAEAFRTVHIGRSGPKTTRRPPRRCVGSFARAPSFGGPEAAPRVYHRWPEGTERITTDEHIELINLLNGDRIAGHALPRLSHNSWIGYSHSWLAPPTTLQ